MYVCTFAGWASRTYYSDNGSTAIEIALKMAFRKFSFDNGLLLDFSNNNRTDKSVQLKVNLNNPYIFQHNISDIVS
jgi:dethiobiotin synthetase/adenosylmethionine--8-amino-7-oxononanoate aminotransferase